MSNMGCERRYEKIRLGGAPRGIGGPGGPDEDGECGPHHTEKDRSFHKLNPLLHECTRGDQAHRLYHPAESVLLGRWAWC